MLKLQRAAELFQAALADDLLELTRLLDTQHSSRKAVILLPEPLYAPPLAGAVLAGSPAAATL